ncbi:MAG: hypothetical protein KF819_21505 [Labilithrix sp.]|nr:hypothetical protein [Labilithrix sp.]
MDPPAAADVLRRRLTDPKKPLSVADASVESGLSLHDAEVGLHHLTQEYRGHLRVTEDGDLVHVFPHGFEKPWETKEAFSRAIGAIGRGVAAAGRFIVRAWLLIAMVAYALVFVGIVIGLTFARQGSSDREGDTGVHILGGIFRALADALFWTFHPWSPLYIGGRYETFHHRRARHHEPDGVPFYEKVNRFVFGPTAPPPDPQATRTRILEEIRAQKGRIGLADVMRVTGLPRDEADPLMARLMLDYDGSVEVGDQGGIVYRFEAIRRTASDDPPRPYRRRAAAWDSPPKLAPLTGNSGGANVGIALLNGFNLVASAFVMAGGLTLANIGRLLFAAREVHPRGAPIVLPDDGLPIALGLVPFLFSLAIFVLPIARSLTRRWTARNVAKETARLAILREVLTRAPKKEPVSDEVLRKVYRVATGEEPTSKEITKRVVDLGGDVDVGPEGEVRYRFADLEADAEALEEERRRASDAEARLGKVVFASDD